MNEELPTRAQRLAQEIAEKQGELIVQGVLSPETARREHKAPDRESGEQLERRRAALAKLKTFVE